MKLSVSRTDIWAATIEDRPGGLAEKLDALSAAGVNLEFIISRRTLEQPGKGVVFVTPIKGARQVKAAQKAGFQKSDSLHSVRVEGPDKPGMGASITRALSAAELNLRGLSAAAFGRKFVCHVALDTADDASDAAAVLRKQK